MKKLLGVAVFVLLFSLPAHAQNKGAAAGSSSSSTNFNGGGGIGGGSVGGSTRGHLPSYPRASFDVSTVSGGDPSFAPSTFLSFDQAVAEGKAILATERKSLAQIAAENSTAPKAKARFTFVQDTDGNVVPAAQQ